MTEINHRQAHGTTEPRFFSIDQRTLLIMLLTVASSLFLSASAWAQVTLYSEENYRGDSETFTSNVSDLERGSRFGAERARSARVTRGCEATLYDGPGYSGRAARLTSDTATLARTVVGLDSAVSLSLRCDDDIVPEEVVEDDSERGVVTVFSRTDFQGYSETFSGDDRRLDDNRIGNDGIASARVAAGCRLSLYEHYDYLGRSSTLVSDTDDLTGTRIGIHHASSLKVSCDDVVASDLPDGSAGQVSAELGEGAGAIFYSGSDFTGRSELLDGDQERLSDNVIGDDSISSVRVMPGCLVELFGDAGFRGRSLRVDRDVANLRGLDVGPDTASSLRVRCERRAAWRGVMLFPDSAFRGEPLLLDGSETDLAKSGLGRDRLGSAKVADGCRLEIFTEPGFRGRSLELDADESSFAGTPLGADHAASARATCGTATGDVDIDVTRLRGMMLYERENYSGRRLLVRSDSESLAESGLSQAASLRLGDGCRATLYSQKGFRGRGIEVTGDVPRIDRRAFGAAGLGSIRVRCR